MKKIVVLMICISLLTGFSYADTITQDDIWQILSGMEIITESKNLNENITREELAEILVRTSESASLAKITTRMSVFSDVPYNYEMASYIRLAAINGYMTAYSDGEFKPKKSVKNEEAIIAVLRLLGYTNDDFGGAYPYEQLSISEDIKLTDGVNIEIEEYITKANLQRLIYNALTCQVKGKTQTLAENLGYEISDKNITLGSVMAKNVEGPVTYTEDSKVSKLSKLTEPIVYINGELKEIEDLRYYDVVYYSLNSNTIWAYRDKVTGMLEEVLPNKEAVESVTISGKTYKISTYQARKAFGVAGFSLGNMITTLLDRNGEISDAYLTEELYSEQVGVIISTGKGEKLQTDGSRKVTYFAKIILPSGETMEVSTNSDYSKRVGYAAKVLYKNGKVSIYSTTKTTDIKGIFNTDTNTIGFKYKMSNEINILEMDKYGNTNVVYPERLNGVYLEEDAVALISKNSDGMIESIIIKNVTGDTAKYGIIEEITGEKESEAYTCIVDGNLKNYSNSNISFNVKTGPVQIYLNGQSLEYISNLTKVDGNILNVNNAYIENSKGEKLKVSSDVAVYIRSNYEYNLSDMDEAMNGEHSVSAYYDEAEKDGGRVRIIILN